MKICICVMFNSMVTFLCEMLTEMEKKLHQKENERKEAEREINIKKKKSKKNDYYAH